MRLSVPGYNEPRLNPPRSTLSTPQLNVNQWSIYRVGPSFVWNTSQSQELRNKDSSLPAPPVRAGVWKSPRIPWPQSLKVRNFFFCSFAKIFKKKLACWNLWIQGFFFFLSNPPPSRICYRTWHCTVMHRNGRNHHLSIFHVFPREPEVPWMFYFFWPFICGPQVPKNHIKNSISRYLGTREIEWQMSTARCSRERNRGKKKKKRNAIKGLLNPSLFFIQKGRWDRIWWAKNPQREGQSAYTERNCHAPEIFLTSNPFHPFRKV